MTDTLHRALLPDGLHDVLPPDAEHEAALVERLMAIFARHGYDRVKPPLIEFEDSLLSGSGVAMAKDTFRLMDPVSQRMMAVRPDITLQVARIATTRLVNAERPVRLGYAGQVLRVKGGHLRPERQFTQVGVELIGPLEAAADAEVVLLAAEALRAVGVHNASVDLNVPTLVPAVVHALGVPTADARRLRLALDRRDAADLAAVGGPAAALLGRLMEAAGRAERAVALLAGLDLPPAADADRRRLTDVVSLVRQVAPDLMLTVDPVEFRGFEYQTGLSFTLFARGVRGELGHGGRYRAGFDAALALGEPPSGEPATGFTLYLDTLLRAVPPPEPPKRIFVPHGTPPSRAAALRDQDFVTVAGLKPVADPVAEARRLGCGHLLQGDAAVPLDGTGRDRDTE